MLKDISCRMGALTSEGCTAVIVSHTSENVTLTVGHKIYDSIVMTKVGDDRATPDTAGVTHAMYVGTQVVTGLKPFVEVEYLATQLNKSDAGFSTPKPGRKGTKFALAFATCFRPNSRLKVGVTAWDMLKAYIDTPDNPKVLACLFSDDICYADGAFGGGAGIHNEQGKVMEFGTTSNGERSQYDFGISYGSWFGIISPFASPGTTDYSRVGAGSTDEAFQYCMSRMAFMPSWGDHEFQENLGWFPVKATADFPNAYHKTDPATAGYDGSGLLSYNQLMKPLQGESYNVRDLNSNLWFTDFGSFRYVAVDATTNGDYSGGVIMGDNQIDDIKDLANGGQWFTCISLAAVAGRGLPNVELEMAAAQPSGFYNGSVYKDENFIAAEYNRLWLDTTVTPVALMVNDHTNGNLGASFMMRGDWHDGPWLYWKAPATGILAAESIPEITLSTVNASTNTNSSNMHEYDAGYAADNCELIGAANGITFIGNTIPISKPDILRMTIAEIDETKQTPEMVIKQWCIENVAMPGAKENWTVAAYDLLPVGDSSQSLWFNENLQERLTDENGNVWRVVAERRIVLSGVNSGYKLDDPDTFELKVSAPGDGD